MLKSALQIIIGGKTEINSADLLMLQAKSYRLVKNEVSPLLYKHNISTLEWGFLGIVKTCATGSRYIDLSNKMGVEPPFVTAIVTKLLREKLIKIVGDAQDRRAKMVILSSKGAALVEKLEPLIDERLQNVLDPISTSDFKGYIAAMTTITDAPKRVKR
ncbi:hypothetical protein KBD81_04620 [Candidatus Woesebacteria bacterium]|nr:hypothetical protein [Candidatus Woesebacteria bacterium]